MTRLSIVIPCLRGAEQAEETLISILQNRPGDCEVLVAHARPYGDPYNLADEVRFIHLPGKPSLVELVNAAVEEAAGDIIHTLACGIQVEEGWIEPALAPFADPHVGAVSPLIVQSQQPTRIEALGVGYTLGGLKQRVGHNLPLPQRHKLGYQVLGPTLAAGFFCRELLDALGGFEAEVGDELADIDLALSLAELGFRTVVEPSCKLLAGAEFAEAPRAGALFSGRHCERLFLRHAAARGGIWAVLAHPLAIAADFLGGLPGLGAPLKLVGRIIAAWEFGIVHAYKQRMADAADYLTHEPSLEEARRLIEREIQGDSGPVLAQPDRKAA